MDEEKRKKGGRGAKMESMKEVTERKKMEEKQE